MNTAARIVSEYLSAFATGDADRVAAFVADDFVNEHLSELGTGCQGRQEYRRRLCEFLSTFVGATYSVDTIVAVAGADAGTGHDAEVVVRYRFAATYYGTVIDIPGIMWFSVRDGLVAKRTDLWDSLTFLRQTGQPAPD